MSWCHIVWVLSLPGPSDKPKVVLHISNADKMILFLDFRNIGCNSSIETFHNYTIALIHWYLKYYRVCLAVQPQSRAAHTAALNLLWTIFPLCFVKWLLFIWEWREGREGERETDYRLLTFFLPMSATVRAGTQYRPVNRVTGDPTIWTIMCYLLGCTLAESWNWEGRLDLNSEQYSSTLTIMSNACTSPVLFLGPV